MNAFEILYYAYLVGLAVLLSMATIGLFRSVKEACQ